MNKKESLSISSKIIIICVTLTTIGATLTSINSLMSARILGTIISVILTSSVFAFLLGIIPYLIIRKKVVNPSIKVFGVLITIFQIMVIIGSMSKW